MRILFILCFLFTGVSVYAQCDSATSLYFQNFEGATPANGPTGWITKGVDYTQTGFTGLNSLNRVGLNSTTDTVISSPQVCPADIDFWWRSSGATSVWTLYIQYSTNLSTWVTLDSIKATGSGAPTSYVRKTISFPYGTLLPPFIVYVRFNMVLRNSGACYIDNFCLTKGVCHAVASELNFTSSTTNCVPSNIPFSTTVCATDANDYVDTTFNGPISLSLASGSGTLGGTLTANAVAGCAVFNNVSFSGVAPLSIVANSGSFTTPAPLTTLDIRSSCPNVDTLKMVTYNLLNFPRGGVYSLGGACTPQETNNTRIDTLKSLMQYIKPDILVVQELQTQGGADSILSHAFNVGGVTKYAMAPYIPNQSTANVNYNNECYYNTEKLVLYQTTTIPTSIRDVGVYKFYLKDPLLNVHLDTTWLDVYSIHTKAKGLGAAQATLDSIQRANDCKRVMDSIRARQSTERNAVIGGDMNLYTSNEGAFIAFTSGLYKFNDPVNQPGDWESNIAFAPLHTQAARSSTRPSLECGARGGLDSRLDFLLNSDPIMTGSKRITYVPNSYQAFGNDRMLFNRSVDSNAAASQIPAHILRQLANMSDHVPVIELLAVEFPSLSPLAVSNELKLKGVLQAGNAHLSWNCSTGLNIKGYIVQRNGQDICELTQLCSLMDFAVPLGKNHYRVKAVLTNGEVLYSNVITLAPAVDADFLILPNPFANQFSIQAAQLTKAQLRVLRTDGTVQLMQTDVTLSSVPLHINAASWPAGTYILQIIHNGNIVSRKLLKQ